MYDGIINLILAENIDAHDSSEQRTVILENVKLKVEKITEYRSRNPELPDFNRIYS